MAPGQANAGPSGSGSNIPIDLALCPLPDDDDNNFPPPHMILPKIARPASKVAGSRRATVDIKGKGRADASSSKGTKRKAVTPLDEPEGKKKRGRAAGVVNYNSDDLDGLLDILEELLPIGGKAWNTASDEFCAWAEENG